MVAGPVDPSALLERARAGDRAALARLITLVEQGGAAAHDIGRLAHPLTGSAHTVGITGAPGAGKSTLTSALVAEVRGRGDEVAVLAVDPSSPFTGGAILGDRVRMGTHDLDDGVFIRSMATRGHLGGLALATAEVVRLLDATGLRWVVVETVGVGQVEVEVVGTADTVVVVVNPGWGDAVQANKAGLMEIADIFVINKADRPGATETRRDLDNMLSMSGAHADGPWRTPVIETVATDGRGRDELWDAIVAHCNHLETTGELVERRRQRVGEELRKILAARLLARVTESTSGAGFEALRAAVLDRSIDPWSATDQLLDRLT